ncbi:MAG: chemotaxis protein CheW [Nitrospinae bacterium]|nr:chemotaxis protein CheW [Nitrospinota bacterium]
MKALVISVGSNDYLLDMEPIQRITGSGEIFIVHGALDFIKGIIKFRNGIVPVLDLSKRLGCNSLAQIF